MLKIILDFDETTKTVKNVTVLDLDKTSSEKSFKLREDENKLEFTADAIVDLNAVPGDRISINYWTVDNETTYPIVSKSDVFTDGQDGSKLTKKNTVSFKGQQRKSLLKFGELFDFSEFKDKNGQVVKNVFILTPIEDNRITLNSKEESFEEVEKLASDLEHQNVETDFDEDILDTEDLPF
jgi:hypothetical protein